VSGGRLHCPHCGESAAIPDLRGDRRGSGGTRCGLRLWENDDLVPRPDDVFGERLYCIRWLEPVERADGKIVYVKHYRAPDAADLDREARALELLRERFAGWQEQGYILSRRIESGDKTNEPIRTRG
jgi:hypothetical protein